MKECVVIIHPASVRILAEKSWNFSYKVLWKKYALNDEEIDLIKSCIKNYYWSISPEDFRNRAEAYFDAFCRKVIEAAAKIHPIANITSISEEILSVG